MPPKFDVSLNKKHTFVVPIIRFPGSYIYRYTGFAMSRKMNKKEIIDIVCSLVERANIKWKLIKQLATILQ